MLASLTVREEQVLELRSQGVQVKELAHRLGITRWTAYAHLSNAARKLGANDADHAVIIYVRARSSAA